MKSFVRTLLVLALLAVGLPLLAEAPEYDECDANFLTYVGADAYQFAPGTPGELGSDRLFAIFSFQRAGALRDFGRAFWLLEIRGPDGDVVRRSHGTTRIDARGAGLAEFVWDGRNEDGAPVEQGAYTYTFLGRFLPDRIPAKLAHAYEDLETAAGVDEAFASTRQVIVDYGLDVETARQIRRSLALSSCQTQQNAAIEPGFPYQYFYGSTHSHSNYSDGGQPTTACSSGNAYGSGSFGPAAVYDYARNTAGMDFWVVNEHNHLINDSVATNNGPVTEAKVRQRYQDGMGAAAAANADGAFVAIYGMEWGVTTNADQGHVTLLETPALFGWETCTSCNGPNPECTPGINCYFDVFTPKRYGYLTMYARSVENPSPAGALGILCHPSSGEFDNYAFDANADEALQGVAVRSGLAFNTATTCADANVGATDYSSQWKSALNKGFHVGPVADHDAHCNNFGVGLPTRTVYLAASKTKAAILAAHKARHFFASEDANAQLVFATSDNAHVMGDIFDAGTSLTLRGALYDPAGEGVSTIELWRGQIGAGVPSSAYRSFAGQSSFSVTETLASGSYYYYVHGVQADGNDVWSSPMWVTYGKATCADQDAPSVTIVAPASGSSVSGNVTIQVTASDAGCGVQSVEVSVDGGAFTPAAWNGASGTYELLWSANAAKCTGPATIDARATDKSSPAHMSAAVPVGVTVVSNDATAPAVSITAPASGGTIACANTTVRVSASDASGIRSVEVQVDGGAWNAATANAGAWEWTWASAAAASGSHTIAARATDSSCSANAGSAAPVSVTVDNTSCGAPSSGLDISGWKITQSSSTATYVFPAGTKIPDNGYLILGRSATKAEFEAFWRAGTPLPANAVYVNTAGAFPVINGSEIYNLYNAAGTKVDGQTIAMGTSGGQSIGRKDPCLASRKSGSWTVSGWANATPGTGAGAGCAKGVVINEFADPSNSGDYVYEFVELYYDRN